MAKDQARTGLLQTSKTLDSLSSDQLGDAARQREEAQNRAGLQKDIYEKISPYAENLLSMFSPEAFKAERPDMAGGIRRDYSDDRAAISDRRNEDVAGLNSVMTAGGLTRSAPYGSGVGDIYGGASQDLTGARRNYQNRLEQESLSKYADSRSRAQEGAQLATVGANMLSGQQAAFNPIAYEGLTGASMSAAGQSKANSGNALVQRSQIASPWEKALGAAGSITATALGAKGLWK
jgi:hypothetical protein